MAFPVIDCTGVEVRGEHVVALRSLLKGEPGSWEPFQVAESPEEAIAYTAMLYGAFKVAVWRKFSPTYSTPDVIRFVADMRIAYGRDVSPIHPHVAEQLILEALGNPAAESYVPPDAESVIGVEAAVLDTLLHEENLDEAGLEEFIEDSADFVREWIAARQGEPCNM
ncbi:hypothetical protein FHX41_2204 [Actinomadura hallensis]|uniref:Uncharacterized protein n=1 Tax=Actinomadura hallensis TaxID=337895 RepID=A0A543ID99_9ACTN|nr:hypothetical protein [Actinomadura hallensis]TQM68555.1 hypothetical protein FHX41_2204 [Actinomadura hallensis]